MVRVLVIAVVASGCVYARGGLAQEKGVYRNYPASVEAEEARRKTRRRHALIAAPLEIVGGAAVTALAFAPSSPMDDGDDSVADGLGDAGAELAGRVLLASVGTGLVLGGLVDLLFGITDPLHRSPLVRDGVLVPADRIDTIAPPRAPRLTVHADNVLGTRSTGGGAGLGVAHWASDRVRVRYAASGTYAVAYHGDQLGGVLGEATVELAFAREQAGLYPRRSVGLYGGGGWIWTSADDGPAALGGFLYDGGQLQWRLGARHVVGVDRYPSIDLGLRLELGGD